MGVSLDVTVRGVASAALSERWQSLAVSDGIGHETDSATLTLSVPRAADVDVPPLGVPIAFAVRREAAAPQMLAALHVSSVSGDTRAGTVTIEAAALPPETLLREQRARSWSGQTLRQIVDAIAARAGLVADVSDALAETLPVSTLQNAESDQQFLNRLIGPLDGRVVVKGGCLLVLAAGARRAIRSGASLPPIEVGSGAWVRWRRSDRQTEGTVTARYYGPDGATIQRLRHGDAPPRRLLPDVYGSVQEATLAAARFRRLAGATRDWIEIQTALTPAARALYPLVVADAPPGFSGDLTIYQVRHAVGRDVSTTTITARPDGDS